MPIARSKLAVPVLLLVCLIWAGAFIGLELGAQPLHAIGLGEFRFEIAALFLAVRFTLAALLMPLVLPSGVRRASRYNTLAGALLGLCFSAHLLTQLVGMGFSDMEPGRAAFLTALFVVFAPLLAYVFLRRKPRTGVLIGIPLAILGVAYIGGPPSAGLSLAAWLNVAAAAIYGAQIVITDVVTRRGDTMAQTQAMIVVCALICWVAFAVSPRAAEFTALPGFADALMDPRFWLSELYLAVISTVIALALVNRWQREVSPNHAAILFTSTPVFATIMSIAVGEETVTLWLFFGAGMILLANLSAQFIGRKPPAASTVATEKL